MPFFITLRKQSLPDQEQHPYDPHQSTEPKQPDSRLVGETQPELASPTELRKLADRLSFQHQQETKRRGQIEGRLKNLDEYLSIADDVTDALDVLSQKLFEEVLGLLESKLSIALHEVLEQPIQFRADANFKRGSAVVDFAIERDGNSEDVNRGQGGSVHNVLSVGLRMFALATLDPQVHRRFLVLDEQDCWLRPELVPRLVNIVHQAAKELDFQVIMISHHDTGWFEKYADCMYQFTPSSSGVLVEKINPPPAVLDTSQSS